jgi:hypothetical protein
MFAPGLDRLRLRRRLTLERRREVVDLRRGDVRGAAGRFHHRRGLRVDRTPVRDRVDRVLDEPGELRDAETDEREATEPGDRRP